VTNKFLETSSLLPQTPKSRPN